MYNKQKQNSRCLNEIFIYELNCIKRDKSEWMTEDYTSVSKKQNKKER